MYWSTSEVLRMPLYPSIMPINRFSDIMRFFHLSNNQIPDPASVKCDKLNKLRPLLDFILPKFGSLYYPGPNLSPDESMLKFKRRLSFLQYMPRKPVKWGHEGILFERVGDGLHLFLDSVHRICYQGDKDFNVIHLI